MELWQGLRTNTKAHVQKSSCFIVWGRTELCFLQGSSKQQSLKFWATGGWPSQRKMNTLVPKLSYGLHRYVIASTCAQRIQIWTVRFTHFVKLISVFIHASIKTIAHTRFVTLLWPELQSCLARIIFNAFMWLYNARVCTYSSNILSLNSFDVVINFFYDTIKKPHSQLLRVFITKKSHSIWDGVHVTLSSQNGYHSIMWIKRKFDIVHFSCRELQEKLFRL